MLAGKGRFGIQALRGLVGRRVPHHFKLPQTGILFVLIR